MRLGEILVADGLVLEGDVARLLDAQRRTHRRLGQLLVAAGLVTADAVARGLSRQHGVPAALQKHLDGRDASLAGLLRPDTARRFGAVPLARSRDGALVVCMRHPERADAVAALAAAVGTRVVAAVASDALLLPLIEDVYGAADDDDFDVDVDHDDEPVAAASAPGNDQLGALSGEFTLARLDDVGVARDFSQSSPTGPVQATGLRASGEFAMPRAATAQVPGLAQPRTITDSAVSASSVSLASAAKAAADNARAAAEARDDARRISAAMQAADDAARMAQGATLPAAAFAATLPMPAAPAPAVARTVSQVPPAAPAALVTVDATMAQIDAAPTRDAIAEAAVAFCQGRTHAALVLVIRDGAALGHRGFAPELTATAIEAVALPLSTPSVIKQVVETRQPFFGLVPEGSALAERFLRIFGGRELAAVPVALSGRVVCVLAVRPRGPGAITPGDLADVSAAMSDAFGRLIRDKRDGKRAETQA